MTANPSIPSTLRRCLDRLKAIVRALQDHGTPRYPTTTTTTPP